MDRRIKDLDDVNRELRTGKAEGSGGPKREEELRKLRRGSSFIPLDLSRWLRPEDFAGAGSLLRFPAAILVLIVLVLILERAGFGMKGDPSSPPSPEAATQSELPESTEETTVPETEDPTIVKEYHDNVLEDFFKRYFDAKLAADVDTLYQMSGVTNQTEAQKAQLAAQLKTQAGYIERYQDIAIYAVKGLEENAKLVFITYNVKFRRSDTLAPAIMYCYMKVNEANQFELVENMSPEQAKFVNDYTTNHQEVVELINSTNSRLLQALSSDSRLAVIYDAFQTGRIYKEDQSKIDSEVSLISVDGGSESSGESAAANASSVSGKSSASGKKSGAAGSTESSSPSNDVISVGQAPTEGGASSAPSAKQSESQSAQSAGTTAQEQSSASSGESKSPDAGGAGEQKSPAGSGDVIEAGENPGA